MNMFAVIVILVQYVIISSVVDADKKVVFKIEVPNFVKHQHHTKIVYLHKYDEPSHHHHPVHHHHDVHHDHNHGHHHHHHVNPHRHNHGHHVPHHHVPHHHKPHHHHPPPKKPKKPIIIVHKKPHAYHHYNYGHNHGHHFSSSHGHHGPHYPIMKHYQVKPGQYKVGSYANSPGLRSGFHTRVNFGQLVEPDDKYSSNYKNIPNSDNFHTQDYENSYKNIPNSADFHTQVKFQQLVEPDDTEKLQKQKIEPVVGNDFDVENIEDVPKSNNYESEKVQEEPVINGYEVTEDHPHDFNADVKNYDHEYDHFKTEQYPFKETESSGYEEDYTNPFSVAKYTSNIRHGTIDLEETNYGPNHGSDIEKYISDIKDSPLDFDD